MKSAIYIWHAMSICFLILSSCDGSKELPIKAPVAEEQKSFSDFIGENILKDFRGIVTDSIGHPLESVSITIGNTTTLTDANGKFLIENTMVNERFAFVNVNKEGYKHNTIDISDKDSLKSISIQLNKESEPCLFWFCRHNHSLK